MYEVPIKGRNGLSGKYFGQNMHESTNKSKENGKQDCQEQRTDGGIQGCLVSRSSYSLESLKALHFDLERAHEVVLGLVKRVLMVLGPKEVADDRLLKEVC